MIPTLYEAGTTTYTTNGIGRLSDAVSCIVTEERNGSYELVMTYPITGIHYDDLALGRIIYAEPSQWTALQPFRIYRISRPINGIVTVNAEHISYMLRDIVVRPFTANSCLSALQGLKTNAINACPFTFNTDKIVASNFVQEIPHEIRGLLGGEAGSILDVYGKGEYEFNGFSVYLHTNRGTDNGVTIQYGKNLSDLVRDTDISGVYTGIAPYWQGMDDTVVLPEGVVYSDHRGDFPNDIIKPVDFSARWQEPPTVAQLRTAAQAYVQNNEGWEIKDNIKVSFVALWQSEEYKDQALLERVHLCDTVTIVYTALGVIAKTKVIQTEYDVLLGRYISIELGTARNSLSGVISDGLWEEVEQSKQVTVNLLEHQADLMRGGLGGYMYTNYVDDRPAELLFMDTPSIETATQCLRINKNGICFSPGYNATPTTAWTLDGVFYANWIQAGTMAADRVRTGTLASADNSIVFDLTNNTLTCGNKALRITAGNFTLDANGNVAMTGTVTAQAGSKIGPWDVGQNAITYNNGSYGVSGLYFGTSGISLGSTFKVSNTGVLEATGATIDGTVRATDGAIGGWTLAANNLHSGSGASYVALSSNTSGTYALWAGNETAGSAPFRVSRAGVLTATGADISGTVTATNGSIGGFTIDATSIRSAALTAVTSGAIGLSTVDFTRTIGGVSRGNLRFAIGSGFGVDEDGKLYAGAIYQHVNGVNPGEWHPSILPQASIVDGIVSAGQVNINGVRMAPEGADTYNTNGVYVDGHFSTNGTLWCGQDTDFQGIIGSFRGKIEARDLLLKNYGDGTKWLTTELSDIWTAIFSAGSGGASSSDISALWTALNDTRQELGLSVYT